ncbi:hypothetical protein ACFPID_06615 [Bifidobacterium leontopitheci]|uniref:hypothetical protein n=1 Tax=Bifidobacterium leontopitheci TaxID=2650774 RepID=UPI0012649F6C|nr:hypothetical protein [Bifidobacterium leontopitheci]
MVRRALLNEDMPGVTQSTQTAGGFTESLSYSNPAGDLIGTSRCSAHTGIGGG